MSRTWVSVGVTNTIPAVNVTPSGVLVISQLPGNSGFEGIELAGRATAGNLGDKLVLLRKEIISTDYRFCPVKPDKSPTPISDGVSGWFNVQYFLARAFVQGEFIIYCPASLVFGTGDLEAPRARVF